MTTATDIKFSGKSTVSVRCGGNGVEWVGKTVAAKTKAGDTKYVILAKLIKDWGVGDVCEYEITWA